MRDVVITEVPNVNGDTLLPKRLVRLCNQCGSDTQPRCQGCDTPGWLLCPECTDVLAQFYRDKNRRPE